MIKMVITDLDETLLGRDCLWKMIQKKSAAEIYSKH